MAYSSSSASSSSSSSASSCSHPFTHHVFLSFRGTDTRFGFTNHLYNALQNAGIKTFMDDYKLIKGEDISESLLQAIEASRISVIIFSENYAASSWCLNELVKILECRKLNKQRVIPVFYKVEPSHVRHQTGSFGKALDELQRNTDKVHGWRAALTEAANLSGHYYKDGYEADKIVEIVSNISGCGIESYNSNAKVVDHVYSLDAKVVDQEYSLDAKVGDEEYPLDNFKKIISRYGENKVIFYTKFNRKDCDAVKRALEHSGVQFYERNIEMYPKFLSELRSLLSGHVTDPAVPCLFVKGRFLGEAKELVKLLNNGTLKNILKGLPKEADGPVCDVCGELRNDCPMCSGTGHSFGWIRVSGDLCSDCGGKGLQPCGTYGCGAEEIIEIVNNKSSSDRVSSSSNAKVGDEEYALDNFKKIFSRDDEYPLDNFKKIFSQYGENKVIFYTKFNRKDCDAVNRALEHSGVKFFERNIEMYPKFLSELRSLLRGYVTDPVIPCLFVKGRFLGEAKELVKLLNEGTLKNILHGLPKQADGPVCDVCGEIRNGCPMCSGTGHSFGWIRVSGDLCSDCGGKGLQPCGTYRCEADEDLQIVNNISAGLGTEPCSSSANVVDVEYPLDDFKKVIPRYGENKVIFYTKFGTKDCDAVNRALEHSGVKFLERNIEIYPRFLSELRTLLSGHVTDPAVPCLFVKGRFLGEAKELVKLLNNGTLNSILRGLPKEADGYVCDVCGELRNDCPMCSGTGHRFGWIRVSGDLCSDCGGKGLQPCGTYGCDADQHHQGDQ